MKKIFSKLRNQKLLIENYIFLTIMQLLNSLFYFIIYPYSIRVFGAADYGSFIFSTNLVSYITLLISFGIDIPALKILSENINSIYAKSELLSEVFSTKIMLTIISIPVLILLILVYPSIKYLLIINSFQAFSSVFLMNWYFQGLQKMRFYVTLQLIFKVLSVILIYVLVKDVKDLYLYSFIISGSVFLCSYVSYKYLTIVEQVKVRLVRVKKVIGFIKYSYHFFLNSSISIIRNQSTTLFVGTYVGMHQVSYYDLASKIILLPQSLVSNINNALFPKILRSRNISKTLVKKVFFFEFLIGLFFIGCVIFLGKIPIQLFISENVEMVHNVVIILSITIMSWLLVGCIVNFVFIPKERFDLITKNQLIAFISFFAFSFLGIAISRSVYVIALAVGFSAICEIFYCFLMVFALGFFNKKFDFVKGN